jgi:hypothetical protein
MDERLRALLEKLTHPVQEIRWRAIRNLRLKLSNGLLEPGFFREAGSALYGGLAGLLKADTPSALREEALSFVTDVCKQAGHDAKARWDLWGAWVSVLPCLVGRLVGVGRL